MMDSATPCIVQHPIWSLLILLLAAGGGALVSLWLQRKRTRSFNRQLEALSNTDPLTGIANRKHFDKSLSLEIARHGRSGAELSLLVLDLNHSKENNNSLGLVQGEHSLRRVADQIATCCFRPADVASRYSDEKFACILPETGAAEALRIAEKIRTAILGLHQLHPGNSSALTTSVSIGVVTIVKPLGVEPSTFVNLADNALYLANSLGRNRIEQGEYFARNSQPTPRSLPTLEWLVTLQSGHPHIDGQHRSLYQKANALLEALVGSATPEEIAVQSEALFEELCVHFEDEERILTEIQYPQLRAHAGEHTRLTQRALALAAKLPSGPQARWDLIIFLAFDVVKQHMFSSDKQFYPYLESANLAAQCK